MILVIVISAAFGFAIGFLVAGTASTKTERTSRRASAGATGGPRPARVKARASDVADAEHEEPAHRVEEVVVGGDHDRR